MKIGRRTFLGSSLAFALGLSAKPAFATGVRRLRSVLWLWIDGGMSQIHTWDPKVLPAAPKPIATSVPGIQLSELMPLCAAQMHHLSIIRTLSHTWGHGPLAKHLMHTGLAPDGSEEIPSIGTILAHELGKKDFPLPKFMSMGTHAAIPESSVFGEECQPFPLSKPGLTPIPNLRRNVSVDRDMTRAALLLEQNQEWVAQRLQSPVRRLAESSANAEALINTPLLKAMDIEAEPPTLREAYGQGFGQQCLLARRLAQAGCSFVEVGLEDAPRREPILDKGLGTLIKDLAEKDLLRDTLVVCAAECGRAPHADSAVKDVPWSQGFSVVLAGGPLPGGIVYGDTGPRGIACDTPVSVQNFFATVYSACGVDWEKEYRTNQRKRTYTRFAAPLEQLF